MPAPKAEKLGPMIWFLFRGTTPEQLGYIPSFLDTADSRPAREQFQANYVGGWHPMLMDEWKWDPKSLALTYPDDPPMFPRAYAQLRGESIFFYPHDWVMIVQKDGSFEIDRMD